MNKLETSVGIDFMHKMIFVELNFSKAIFALNKQFQ
ncbi:hypothetical protein MEG1DRAFT_03606 [Photorhabdus temperata subsp. temperata Meg1]|uniref:Uncharacterized protein n=2 Tax=Photorhabdus temperata TaxID=574560 RepID=A0A081RT18_PHOTE|nr:hypothetical protein O185_16270 [Photorhabdus temperata J3]KER01821.1 hypothetical protein MEG1DRAFT_03606 [Photorhabdus temperata subsp. temperata Meg1]